MRRMTRLTTSALLLLLLFWAAASTAVYGADITITQSATVTGGGYDGVTAFIGDLRDTLVMYTLRRPVISSRGLTLMGTGTPATGKSFTCLLDKPAFYSGTFFIWKSLPTNGLVKVDSMRAVMDAAVPVVDLSEARLTNNVTVLVMQGSVEYTSGVAAAVVSVRTAGTPTMISGSTLSIIGLTVVRAASVLSMGGVGVENFVGVVDDGMLTVDACKVTDLRDAVVEFRNGMALSEGSVFRLSGLSVVRGDSPMLLYTNEGGQNVLSGSLYIVKDISSGNAMSSVFSLTNQDKGMPLFAATEGAAVSFLDITAKSMGVDRPVPDAGVGAPVFAQRCRINGFLLPDTLDAYYRAFIAATTILENLRDVSSRKCEPALCVPGFLDVSETNGQCYCECNADKQKGMCSAQPDRLFGFVRCYNENCRTCTTIHSCTECFAPYSVVNGECTRKKCEVSQCSICEGADCYECESGYSLLTSRSCVPCDLPNCQHCKDGTSNECDACMPGYTVSDGQCVPYAGCKAPNCEQCITGDSESCDQCLPTYGMTSAGTCKRCTEANCLTCGNGDGPCTSCASGYKISGSGCVSEDDAAAGVLRAGWVLLLAAVGSLILILA